MKPNLLPRVQDAHHYMQIFKQDDLWPSAIQHLADRHGLAGTPRRSATGSHIVYRVGAVWIKLMAPIFARDMAYEVAGLEVVQGKLSVATPRILFKGELEGWPYIVVANVDGERIGDVFPKLTPQQQEDLCRQIAHITKELHFLKANTVIESRGEWNSFIRERLHTIVAHHQRKNMAAPWLQNLASFIGQFEEAEFLMDRPVFLHADLTWDHFLVTAREGSYRVSGMIDFADCRMGHPEYEMVATLVFILKGNAPALRTYLQAMTTGTNRNTEKIVLDVRYSEKLLAWTLLHYFSDLQNYFSDEMAEIKNADFSELARVVFPLDG